MPKGKDKIYGIYEVIKPFYRNSPPYEEAGGKYKTGERMIFDEPLRNENVMKFIKDGFLRKLNQTIVLNYRFKIQKPSGQIYYTQSICADSIEHAVAIMQADEPEWEIIYVSDKKNDIVCYLASIDDEKYHEYIKSLPDED